jgi:signal transduction histidine kinase
MRRLDAVKVVGSALGVFGLSTSIAAASDASIPYVYRESRNLARVVDAAAERLRQSGVGAFDDFRRGLHGWLENQPTLFVFEPSGVCLYHAEFPSFVGKNLRALKDVDGKPLVAEIIATGHDDDTPDGRWIFYHWIQQNELTPSWKASYSRRVSGPDGATYVVGSGLYKPKTEPRFVSDAVDRAVHLLDRAGPAVAFRAFGDRSSQFYFLESSIFVADFSGRVIVDSAFSNFPNRSLAHFTDATDVNVFDELRTKFEHASVAFVEYRWPKVDGAGLIRRAIYGRVAMVQGQRYIVGSEYTLAEPIWMRG